MIDPRLIVPVWVVAAVAICWVVWTIIMGLSQPSASELGAVCAAHRGVASVTRPVFMGSGDVIVCRDGWVLEWH